MPWMSKMFGRNDATQYHQNIKPKLELKGQVMQVQVSVEILEAFT